MRQALPNYVKLLIPIGVVPRNIIESWNSQSTAENIVHKKI